MFYVCCYLDNIFYIFLIFFVFKKYESYEFMINRDSWKIIFSGKYIFELYICWFSYFRQELGLIIILNYFLLSYIYKKKKNIFEGEILEYNKCNAVK